MMISVKDIFHMMIELINLRRHDIYIWRTSVVVSVMHKSGHSVDQSFTCSAREKGIIS